jgi:hypothetical protein
MQCLTSAHHSYTVVVGGAADTAALTLGPHEHFPHLG